MGPEAAVTGDPGARRLLCVQRDLAVTRNGLLANRNRQGSGNGPSSQESRLHPLFWQAKVSLPLCNRSGLAAKGQASVGPRVVRLLKRISPSHVSRLVPLVVVKAIDRMMRGWRRSGGAQERFKGISPRLTHHDAASTVQPVVDILRIVATGLRSSPRAVFPRESVSSGVPMSRREHSDALALQTPTTLRGSGRQLVADYIHRVAAGAATPPDRIADVRLVRCSSFNGQAMKGLSGQIANVRSLWHRPIIARIILIGFAFVWPSTVRAQALAPVISHQFWDDSGVLCANCTLDTWASGTTTDQATYTDSALTTENANPITLSSAGRATIFLSANNYRFRLQTSAGVTIWDVDNVSYVPSGAGNTDVTAVAGVAITAGQVVYLSDGSGALTAGRWYLADSDNTYSSTSAPLVGIAVGAIASAGTGTVRLSGRITGLTSLTAGESYFISATAGALTGTPPTNARLIGAADTTTTLLMDGETGSLRLPDSDGTHTLSLITSSNLTADRRVTINPGDLNRQLTISGDATLNQDVSSTATPTFRAVSEAYSTVTSSFAVSVSTDSFIACDATSGAVTATLPTAATAGPGRAFTMKKTDSSGNACIFARAGSDTIDGATSLSNAVQYDSFSILSDGISAWHIF